MISIITADFRKTLSAQHGTCKHRESRESRHSTCAAVSVKKCVFHALCSFLLPLGAMLALSFRCYPHLCVTRSSGAARVSFFCVFVDWTRRVVARGDMPDELSLLGSQRGRWLQGFPRDFLRLWLCRGRFHRLFHRVCHCRSLRWSLLLCQFLSWFDSGYNTGDSTWRLLVFFILGSTLDLAWRYLRDFAVVAV